MGLKFEPSPHRGLGPARARLRQRVARDQLFPHSGKEGKDHENRAGEKLEEPSHSCPAARVFGPFREGQLFCCRRKKLPLGLRFVVTRFLVLAFAWVRLIHWSSAVGVKFNNPEEFLATSGLRVAASPMTVSLSFS